MNKICYNELIAMEAAPEPPQIGTGWIEFSERHARAASSDFARSVIQYFNSTLQPADIARSTVSHKDLLKTFVAAFSDNFEYEYLRRSVQGNSKVSASRARSQQTAESGDENKSRMNPTDENKKKMKKIWE